jgi:uncharacterized membrane protein YeaQ/YmgE (transglycosylase-associated protein family)
MPNLITALIVGAIAGWLSSTLMKSKGLTPAGYVVLGILGAVVGDVLFGLLGFTDQNFLASVIVATVGSMAVIWLVKQIWKKG